MTRRLAPRLQVVEGRCGGRTRQRFSAKEHYNGYERKATPSTALANQQLDCHGALATSAIGNDNGACALATGVIHPHLLL